MEILFKKLICTFNWIGKNKPAFCILDVHKHIPVTHSFGKLILTDKVRNFLFCSSIAPEGLSIYVPFFISAPCSVCCVYNIALSASHNLESTLEKL